MPGISGLTEKGPGHDLDSEIACGAGGLGAPLNGGRVHGDVLPYIAEVHPGTAHVVQTPGSKPETGSWCTLLSTCTASPRDTRRRAPKKSSNWTGPPPGE